MVSLTLLSAVMGSMGVLGADLDERASLLQPSSKRVEAEEEEQTEELPEGQFTYYWATDAKVTLNGPWGSFETTMQDHLCKAFCEHSPAECEADGKYVDACKFFDITSEATAACANKTVGDPCEFDGPEITGIEVKHKDTWKSICYQSGSSHACFPRRSLWCSSVARDETGRRYVKYEPAGTRCFHVSGSTSSSSGSSWESEHYTRSLSYCSLTTAGDQSENAKTKCFWADGESTGYNPDEYEPSLLQPSSELVKVTIDVHGNTENTFSATEELPEGQFEYYVATDATVPLDLPWGTFETALQDHLCKGFCEATPAECEADGKYFDACKFFDITSEATAACADKAVGDQCEFDGPEITGIEVKLSDTWESICYESGSSLACYPQKYLGCSSAAYDETGSRYVKYEPAGSRCFRVSGTTSSSSGSSWDVTHYTRSLSYCAVVNVEDESENAETTCFAGYNPALP